MLYLLLINKEAASPKYDGVDGVGINAGSSDEAISLAQARAPSARSVWAAATVTELPIENDCEGWTFQVKIDDSEAEPIFDVSVTGEVEESFDDAMARLAVGLNNAEPSPAYSGANLDDASYGVFILLIDPGDALLGNQTVTFIATPPAGLFPAGYEFDSLSLVESIHDQNLASDYLQINFKPTLTLPARLFLCASR
jgi:hypothetical protein